jgi:collagenase-like PrtC family protease
MDSNQNKFRMRYSIGTNFDDRLIEEIQRLNGQDHLITSVFGKLRKDVVGGGRTSMLLPELSLSQLKDYVDRCHSGNIKFNYLLNPMCLGNRELDTRNHKRIIKYIDQLSDIGVDAITVNSPVLCQLIKKQFPHIKITIGLYAYIFNVQHVKHWQELGADELTLHKLVNRNFVLLEELLKYTKKSTLELRLIANNVCIHDCPYQINHGTGQAHASQKGHFSAKMYLDYNLLSCSYHKVKHPEQFLASDWIRPEDVKYYEAVCEKTGNYNLSLKLVERTKSTAFLIKVLHAYAARSFEGNLLEILGWPTMKDANVIHRLPMYLKALLGLYNMKELKKFWEAFQLPNIYIDNKKLEGFLEKFIQHNECNIKICADTRNTDPAAEGDNTQVCSYCKHWAQKAISYDQAEVTEWLRKAESVFDGLTTSRIFYFGKC